MKLFRGTASCEATLYCVSARSCKVGRGRELDTGELVRSYTWKGDQQADSGPSHGPDGSTKISTEERDAPESTAL